MTLIYNHRSDRYEGEALAVPVATMESRMQQLVSGGMAERKARGLLLDEGWWKRGMPGVETIPRLCLHCRQPSGERQFCDVLCEAGFYAEVAG